MYVIYYYYYYYYYLLFNKIVKYIIFVVYLLKLYHNKKFDYKQLPRKYRYDIWNYFFSLI